MDLAPLIYLTSIIGAYSQYSCDVLLPNANVYCISQTEFTVEPQSPCEPNATIYRCPDKLVCTDHKTVCTSDGPAACKLSRACNKCPPDALSSCINLWQYAYCENGGLNSTIKNCQAFKPYCSMEYNSDGNIGVVCTNMLEHAACLYDCDLGPPLTEPPATDPPPTEPTVTEPPPIVEQCCGNGNFKITVDISSESQKFETNECPGNEKEIDLGISFSVPMKKSKLNN